MADKRKVLITLLIAVIIVLVVIIIYAFVIRPAYSGYVIDKQNEGIQIAIFSIMQRAATCQPVPLTFGNQTINIIAVECLQQPVQ